MRPTQPKWARVRRAEKFFLGSISPSAPLSEVEADPIVRCRISRECDRDFQLLLERKGSYQGGPLFGLRMNGELRFQAARPAGPRALLPEAADPLTLHPGYVLGLSDMLEPAQLDWRAYWIAAPDARPMATLTEWANEAMGRGLVDDESPLISVGRDRDGLSYWGLIWNREDETWRDLTILRP